MFQIFGKIAQPSPLARFGGVEAGGLGKFLNVIFNTLVVIAAIYALFNLIFAGYTFIVAEDDPKKMSEAWHKVWHTLVGLMMAAGAFMLAAIFGWLIFKDPTAILSPKIPTP